MILNLKEVAKLEAKYRNDSAALSALYNMVQIASKSTHEDLINPSIAIITLVDLGVLSTTSKKEAEKLNS